MPAGTRDATRGETTGPGLRGLVVLNAVLLLILGAVTFGGTARAQVRAPGSYTMVAGGVNGAQGSAVYIVDTINQEMLALTFDHNTNNLAGVGYRHLGRDAAQLSRRRGN